MSVKSLSFREENFIFIREKSGNFGNYGYHSNTCNNRLSVMSIIWILRFTHRLYIDISLMHGGQFHPV